MPSGRKPAVYRGRGPDDWMKGKENNPRGVNQYGGGKGTGRSDTFANTSRMAITPKIKLGKLGRTKAPSARGAIFRGQVAVAKTRVRNAAVGMRNAAVGAKVNLQSKLYSKTAFGQRPIRTVVGEKVAAFKAARAQRAHVGAVSRKVPLSTKADQAINRSRVGGTYQKVKSAVRYRGNMLAGDVGNVAVAARAKMGMRSVKQRGGLHTTSVAQDASRAGRAASAGASHAWGHLKTFAGATAAKVTSAVHGMGSDHHNKQMSPIGHQAPPTTVARSPFTGVRRGPPTPPAAAAGGPRRGKSYPATLAPSARRGGSDAPDATRRAMGRAVNRNSANSIADLQAGYDASHPSTGPSTRGGVAPVQYPTPGPKKRYSKR